KHQNYAKQHHLEEEKGLDSLDHVPKVAITSPASLFEYNAACCQVINEDAGGIAQREQPRPETLFDGFQRNYGQFPLVGAQAGKSDLPLAGFNFLQKQERVFIRFRRKFYREGQPAVTVPERSGTVGAQPPVDP